MLLSNHKVIVFGAVLVTLIFTPTNFDALIIPKVSIALCVSMYLLPNLLASISKSYENPRIKKFLFASFFWALLHMIIIIISSGAPLEQQIFGRTGRGFGFITYFSFLVFFLGSVVFFSTKNINLIVTGLAISTFFSGVYAIMQRNSLDIFAWDSRTNGIIGTLGNPNFQSAFSVAGYISLMVVASKFKIKPVLFILFTIFTFYLVYICQATQGYLGFSAAIIVIFIIWFWHKNKIILSGLFLIATLGGFVAILGTVNRGPLAYYFYKISVQSRGDFFRSAFTTANEFPLTGVGLDSFGDHYLRNRDLIAVNHTFAELTDNSHNYFLEFAATGGYPLAFLYLLLIFISLYCFIYLISKNKNFDKNIAALFCAWIVFQLQSFVSPGSISIMLWNFVICGAIIGVFLEKYKKSNSINNNKKTSNFSLVGTFLALLGLLIVYPWFNTDRLFRIGLEQKNANTVMQQVNSYPRFVNKFRLVGLRLLESNLSPQALEVAKQSIAFNHNAVSGWALVFYNPSATQAERDKAKVEILRLDPLNKEVSLFKY
jgi:hypothetical protein